MLISTLHVLSFLLIIVSEFLAPVNQENNSVLQWIERMLRSLPDQSCRQHYLSEEFIALFKIGKNVQRTANMKMSVMSFVSG